MKNLNEMLPLRGEIRNLIIQDAEEGGNAAAQGCPWGSNVSGSLKPRNPEEFALLWLEGLLTTVRQQLRELPVGELLSDEGEEDQARQGELKIELDEFINSLRSVILSGDSEQFPLEKFKKGMALWERSHEVIKASTWIGRCWEVLSWKDRPPTKY